MRHKSAPQTCRVCTRCQQSRPATPEFFDRTSKGGLSSRCKICRSRLAKDKRAEESAIIAAGISPAPALPIIDVAPRDYAVRFRHIDWIALVEMQEHDEQERLLLRLCEEDVLPIGECSIGKSINVLYAVIVAPRDHAVRRQLNIQAQRAAIATGWRAMPVDFAGNRTPFGYIVYFMREYFPGTDKKEENQK